MRIAVEGRRRNKRRIPVIVYAIFILAISLGFFFRFAGQLLVVEDKEQRADKIIVLMGSIPDRMLEAVDLYYQGFADHILMVNEYMPGYEILNNMPVSIPTTAEINKAIGTQLWIPSANILILAGDTLSTQDEAVVIRDHLRENQEINSLILVTSMYHSRRAKSIFTTALSKLERDIHVVSLPTKYDNFNASAWWRQREDVKRVFTEYLKLANFYLWERRSL